METCRESRAHRRPKRRLTFSVYFEMQLSGGEERLLMLVIFAQESYVVVPVFSIEWHTFELCISATNKFRDS